MVLLPRQDDALGSSVCLRLSQYCAVGLVEISVVPVGIYIVDWQWAKCVRILLQQSQKTRPLLAYKTDGVLRRGGFWDVDSHGY